MDTIGEIDIIQKEVDIEWKIRNFFSLSTEDGEMYSSPKFSVGDDSWCLMIIPNGDTTIETNGFIDLTLYRENDDPPINQEFAFYIKTVNGEKDREKHFVHLFDNFSGLYSAWRFISRFEVFERRSEFVPDDILTIVCTLKYSSLNEDASESDSMLIEETEGLSYDLKGMMQSGDHSDTTIRVKGEEFRLHKNILGARNLFFNSMFKSDMKESITGAVVIEDCEPDTFRSFIHFMYTGKIDKLSEENVRNLYVLADKYQEEQLKERCIEFMVNNIDYDNFFDFAVLALRHDEEKLLQSATGFFCAKVTQIIRLEEWKTFLREYPTPANELYIKAADHFANIHQSFED